MVGQSEDVFQEISRLLNRTGPRIHQDELEQQLCTAGLVGLQFDVSGPEGEPDCRVDLLDFVEWAATWMNCNIVPECK